MNRLSSLSHLSFQTPRLREALRSDDEFEGTHTSSRLRRDRPHSRRILEAAHFHSRTKEFRQKDDLQSRLGFLRRQVPLRAQYHSAIVRHRLVF